MSSWWDKALSGAPTEERRSVPYTPNHVIPALQQQARTLAEQRMPANTTVRDNSTGETTMGTAIRSWSGGEGHRLDGGLTCPRCGSKNIFSRANASMSGISPAPRCFECGWNGKYEQADQSSWSV